MKLWFFCVLCSVLCLLPLGCGPELTAGGVGVAAGVGFSETIKGMQADLERREAALVQRYNDLLAAGAKAEDLEAVKQQIDQTVNLRQGVQTGNYLFGVDWSDPKAVGGVAGLILMNILTWLGKRRSEKDNDELSESNRQTYEEKELLRLKYQAMKLGQAQLKQVDPAAYDKSYAFVGQERLKLGL